MYLRPFFRLNDNESDKLWELIYYHQLNVSQKFNNKTGIKQAFILMIIIVRRIPIAVDLNYHKNPEICIFIVSNKVLFDK